MSQSSGKAFAPGQRLICRRRDDDERECEVLERRQVGDSGAEYYVHFVLQNRRLDEWVAADRLVPIEPPAPANGSGTDRKRKVGELDPHLKEETPGELDPATRREHEAATRVRNIERIVLGKWEIQTWYFSPFPKEYGDCDVLYFCEYDLHFTKKPSALQRYMKRCQLVRRDRRSMHPP